MTKAELIERIARSRGLPSDLTKKDVGLVLGIAFEEIATYFARARVTQKSAPRFTFPRFGTFTKKRRSARRCVNPQTLEPMEVDAFDTLDFKASRELRESMNATGTVTARARSSSEAKTAAAKPARLATAATKTKSRGKTRTAKATPKPKNGALVGSKAPAKKRRSSKSAVEPKVGKRRLTPRDEDAELDALIDDQALFDQPVLPESRLQRVRPSTKQAARRAQANS